MKIKQIYSGKVRDIYELDGHHLMMVATDRVSAFDKILSQKVPNKGKYLTSISNFWFSKLKNVNNHVVAKDAPQYLWDCYRIKLNEDFHGRSIIVRRVRPIPIEIVVRGYLYGSAYDEYLECSTIGGINFPGGLKLCHKFLSPVITATTKAPVGEKDQPIPLDQVREICGPNVYDQVIEISTEIYKMAADFALGRGIIIGDTKFEFGLNEENQLMLIDELLTPDSSRYWDILSFKEGREPESMDKQILRNYLKSSGWCIKDDKTPLIPQTIINDLCKGYQRIYKSLTAF